MQSTVASTAATTLQGLSSWFLTVTNSFEFPGPETSVCEITPRILAMDFPVPPSRKGDKPIPKADERIAAYFQHKYGGAEHVMVWNLAESSYEGLSALEFKFPGHPSAPLGALFELCASLDSWLDAKPDNVAAIHCATGRGRTLTVIACYLAWSGFNGFTPQKALQYACEKKGVDLYEATIPSQRRYVEYFSRALEGVRPRPEPIVLRSARVLGAPGNSILQMYVDGALVKSVTSKWEADGKVQTYANVDALLDGDVLIRVRHEDLKTKTRVSVFRVALHTGYSPSGVMHLTAEEVDGGVEGTWIEFDFVPRTDRGSTTPIKLSKGLATSEAQFWELIAKRRENNKRRFEEAQSVFSITDLPSSDGTIARDEDIPKKVVEEASRADELDAELSTLLSPSSIPLQSSSSSAIGGGGMVSDSYTTPQRNGKMANGGDGDDDDLDGELEDYLKNLST